MILRTNNKNTAASAEFAPIIAKRQAGKLEQLLSLFPLGFPSSKPVVAVLRLSGVIGRLSAMQAGLSLESLNELIEKTFKIKKLTALCLVINSPGGSPVQSELIAKRIRSLAQEKKIIVYSFVEDVAASGGYWLACAGDQIYASKSSIIGSIGVISSSFGFHEAMSKLGIERRVYAEGKNKSILDPFKPVNKNDIEIIKHLQKQIHEHFIEYTKERRIGKLTQEDNILFNGEFWSGQTALDFGLIDGIDDMYSFINRKFGQDVKIQYITGKQSWLKKKFGMIKQNFPQELTNSLISAVESKIIHDKFNLK